MKVAWLAPYPVSQLEDRLSWGIDRTSVHPCSWIKHLSAAMAVRKDVELHLVTLSPWVTHTQSVDVAGMTIHVIKSGIPLLHRGFSPRIPLDTLCGYRLESRKICAELKRIRPDIVHAHGVEGEYGLAAMRSGYPYLVSIQGIVEEFDKTDPSLHFKLMKPRERQVIQAGHFFTCRTHFDTGFIRRHNPSAHIFDIPEAMGPIFFEGQWNTPSGNRVLHVGGGPPRKGLHALIEAMGEVVKAVPGASIDAAGSCSGERRQQLQQMADALGVKIRFHGFQSAEEIAKLHRKCSLFVLCSSNENSPNTLAEAMVSGMPVVSYNVGGVSSMLDDDRSGILIKPHDVRALSDKISELLMDKEKAREMGRAAAELARPRNHPDHVAQETMAAYRSILEKEASCSR